MKKIVTIMLAFAAFIFSASAQETSKMKHFKHHHGKGMMMKGITLSADQKAQMKTSWKATREQLAALNKNEDITVREWKAKKAAIFQSQKEQMDKLLTPEQKKQIAQNKTDRKAKHEMASAKRLEKMKSHLNLTDDQMTKIKAGRETAKAKAQSIRENGQLSMSEKKEQLIALMKEQKENFKAVLTPEQISKIEAMKKDRMGKRDSK